MSEHEFSEQIKKMESNMQRMRLAIIVLAAFFIYEALGPLPFGRDRVDIQQEIKARELFIVDARGEVIAYLGSDETGAGLFLEDVDGNRLDARPDALRLMSIDGDQRFERLRVTGDGVKVYDENGGG